MSATDEPAVLWCPFEGQAFPGMQQAHDSTMAWAAAVGLARDADPHVSSQQYTSLAARMFPLATPEVFQLVSDFTAWIFWHDDVCDDSVVSGDPARMQREFTHRLDLLLEKGVAKGPIDEALVALRQRFRAIADQGWFVRLVAFLSEYFDGCVWEARNRQAASVPSLAHFVPMRRCAGAAWVYVHFLELTLPQPLPLLVREHRDVVRIRQLTCNITCWHNDLFSLGKEMRLGDVHNLVTVLQREVGLTLARAQELAVVHANDEVRAFLALEERLLRFESAYLPIVQAYLHRLRLFIRGSYDWHHGALRYSSDRPPPRVHGPILASDSQTAG